MMWAMVCPALALTCEFPILHRFGSPDLIGDGCLVQPEIIRCPSRMIRHALIAESDQK